jgi:MFS family permease
MKKIGNKHIALIFISLGWFLILSGRLSISTLLVNIEKALHIGHPEAGVALTAMWLFYGLMQYPSGIISDTKGRKISILLAMTILSVSYLLIGLSLHYVMFFITLILVGIGGGNFPTAGIAMLTDLFKEKRGKALGIQSSAGSIAGFVPIIASIIALYNWRFFFIILAGVSLISTYLFFTRTQESTRLPSQVTWKDRFTDGMSALREKKIVLMFGINLALAFAWIGYMSFFPTYLIESKMFTELYAGGSLFILASSGLILKPFIGTLSDKYDKKIIVLVLTILSAIATLFLVYSSSIPVIFFISFLLSFTSGAFPVISSYLMDQWEEKGRGGKLGFYRSLIILFGSPISAFIGFSADRYGFDFPFLVISLILFITAFLLFLGIVTQYVTRS